MKPALIILAITVVTGVLLWLLDIISPPTKTVINDDSQPQHDEAEQHGCADTSCGLRTICPSEQVLAGQCASEVVYYDDEELDAFSGRGANDYTDDEVEQWRDVLYTLRHEDLLGWGQSIKRRGLVMPATIADELVMLASEH